MLKKIIEWLSAKPKVLDDKEEAAKLEKMVHAKNATCGCGRSTVGHCIGLHKLSAEEWAVHPDNPQKSPVMQEEVAKQVEVPKVVVAEVSTITVTPKISAADLKGLNKKQLLSKAKELNVKVNTRMTKDELIKKLIKA